MGSPSPIIWHKGVMGTRAFCLIPKLDLCSRRRIFYPYEFHFLSFLSWEVGKELEYKKINFVHGGIFRRLWLPEVRNWEPADYRCCLRKALGVLGDAHAWEKVTISVGVFFLDQFILFGEWQPKFPATQNKLLGTYTFSSTWFPHLKKMS